MEKLDVLYMFAKKVLDEKNRGRSLIFVDDKLLEWIDEQVDAGKYYSRSHAIECVVAEIKERGKNKGDDHLAGTSNSLGWNDLDEADRRAAVKLLALNTGLLVAALNERFGDDIQRKIAFLKKRLKDSPLTAIETVAFKKVLEQAPDLPIDVNGIVRRQVELNKAAIQKVLEHHDDETKIQCLQLFMQRVKDGTFKPNKAELVAAFEVLTDLILAKSGFDAEKERGRSR